MLLILLGIVHLVATPHIGSLIRHSTSVEAANMIVPPMLLNHVLVGVLLLPLGWLMLYAAAFCGSCCVGAGGRPHNRGYRSDAPRDFACIDRLPLF